MEEIGAQVAAPIAIHQTMSGRFCNTHQMAKKRGLSFPTPSIIRQNTTDDWNQNSWNWDSARFIARMSSNDQDRVESGTQAPVRMEVENAAAPNARAGVRNGEDGENLRLMLGGGDGAGRGGVANSREEPQPVSRPNKRVRSGSPGGANYPMCQVDNCKEDLSAAKDYHRRHKVCEVHSKAGKALVGKQMQRFCQQCSRFHPLSEFDEGKRSCRRRLAGHNRRRRKTQPEETAPRVVGPGSQENNVNCDIDIANLLAVLTHGKGTGEEKNKFATPDKNQLIQILSKISLPIQANLADKLHPSKTNSLNTPSHLSPDSQNRLNGNAASPSTKNLLAVLSAPPTSHSSDQSQRSTEGSDLDKRKSPPVDQAARVNLPRGEVSSTTQHSPMEEIEYHVQETSPNVPLQLFSSSPEEDGTRNTPSYRNYLSSHSSNPSIDRSPMASPPVVHNLFPMQTSRETAKLDSYSTSDDVAYVKATMSNGCSTSLQLFGSPLRPNENFSIQSSPNQAMYSSSSGSDHSPSSQSSDAQDRTGRIVFKLFDKDPSHLPVSLRTQIFSWLSNSPTEMESYIRPGCIVLSLYLSMSSFAWEHIEENLLNYMRSLTKDTDVDFWANGRFLVHTDKQMASYKDGKIRVCKSWGAWSAPQLISVSPVAVVAGQETSLLLRGRSLSAPSTKIHCTLAAEYTQRKKPALSCQDPAFEEITLDGFKINGATSDLLGRCFIEVENSSRGTCFPVIIADATICRELRLLEPEIHETTEVSEERLKVIHFLEELGWLFQRKFNSSLFESPNYRINRFKFLLIFSVEHGFCALVKTLLDILLEINLCGEGLASESMEMLSAIHLLNRAVRIKSRGMVNLLVHYAVTDPTNASQKYIFSPNMAGPGGITPLHLAACTSFSAEIVDALTSDPQQVGLQNWNSALDANGLSPSTYASMRNNHSYNTLVARKLADAQNGQITLSVVDEVEPFQIENKRNVSRPRSCSRCAVAEYGLSKSFPGKQGLLQRPYLHSMLMVAAVCVCVCLFLRGHPYVGCVSPFAWENLNFGSM